MRRTIALALLVVPSFAAAQETPPATPTASYTRMILGGGFHPDAPVFTLGFEHKNAGAKIAWRVITEYRNNAPATPAGLTFSNTSQTYGLQLLGARNFREGHRVQPYAVAGAAVYHTFGMFRRVFFNPDSSGSFTQSFGPPESHSSTDPALVWGLGTNVRLKGITLFGEMKLPVYSMRHGFEFGPHAPLTFGIRF